MAQRAKYRCPVCKKPLTKKEFDKALHIHEAQQKHIEDERSKLSEEKRRIKSDFEDKERAFKSHMEDKERKFSEEQRAFKSKEKGIKKAATKKAREAERARTGRIVGNAKQEAAKWKRRFELLKRGQTAQEYGIDFEPVMLRRLRTEFPADTISRTPGGRGGDILHTVRENGRSAGSIIYECKWTPRISGSHVAQAARAKMLRRAEFAVLITSGTKRGFMGMDKMGGVFVVHPACLLSMAGLLRQHIVAMLRAGIEKKQRAKIANQLLRFIKSPEFKNPMDEVVRTAETLKDGIKKEFEWHKRNWDDRWHAYGRIRFDGFAIQENLRLVLHGSKPREMVQPRERPALLASA